MKKEGNYYYWESNEDCAECLCRVCARSCCNDSYNSLDRFPNCDCDCTVDSFVIVTTDDCSEFLEDEDNI